MSIPLIILTLGSLFVAYIFKDMIIGVGTSFFASSIFVLPQHISIIEAEFLPPFIKFIPVLLSLFGAILAMVLYTSFTNELTSLKLKLKDVYIFLSNK